MRLLIVGAGSTGGYFGARLIQAGRDVTFLVRPARAAALRETGLQVVSPHGDFTVRPALVTAANLREPFDAVLVAVKAYGLAASIADFAPAVGPDTTILPFLNGLKHVDDLQARFPGCVVGGVCRVSTQLDDAGRVVQLAPVHQVVYGELDGQRTDRIGRLDAFLRDAGFDAILSDHVAQDLWDKWLMLATLGGVCALARGSVGDIAATAGGAELVRDFLAEAVAVATANGHAPSADTLAATTALLTAPGSPLTSSMYRDMMAGRAVEVDQVLGDLRTRARAAGVAAPLATAAFVQLAIHQRRVVAAGAR